MEMGFMNLNDPLFQARCQLWIHEINFVEQQTNSQGTNLSTFRNYKDGIKCFGSWQTIQFSTGQYFPEMH